MKTKQILIITLLFFSSQIINSCEIESPDKDFQEQFKLYAKLNRDCFSPEPEIAHLAYKKLNENRFSPELITFRTYKQKIRNEISDYINKFEPNKQLKPYQQMLYWLQQRAESRKNHPIKIKALDELIKEIEEIIKGMILLQEMENVQIFAEPKENVVLAKKPFSTTTNSAFSSFKKPLRILTKFNKQ